MATVQTMIAEAVNTAPEAIKLYIKPGKEKNLIPLSAHEQLRQINLHIWHSYEGLDIISLPNTIQAP